MRKLKGMLLSGVMLVGALPLLSFADGENQSVGAAPSPTEQPSQTMTPDQSMSAQQPDQAAPPAQADQSGPHSFESQSFFADFKRFKIGDTVPDLYRSKHYQIVEWKKRNLPEPDAGSHWTYMGGNYVLITDADGKILKAESGDIFFSQ
ncbi:hypothetical protein PMPD1_1099 [Paramixta manurensis]|uniref:RcnB family protein n=1 Tax=Paramixta manurensis TaxID=2740817 RepID=A0A6M8U620_9GAMM|nr:hypothetical protein PMPD1_1099 [Erwiniaceae bacterium PD-1]